MEGLRDWNQLMSIEVFCTTRLGSKTRGKAKADYPTKVVPAPKKEGCEHSEQTLDYAGSTIQSDANESGPRSQT